MIFKHCDGLFMALKGPCRKKDFFITHQKTCLKCLSRRHWLTNVTKNHLDWFSTWVSKMVTSELSMVFGEKTNRKLIPFQQYRCPENCKSYHLVTQKVSKKVGGSVLSLSIKIHESMRRPSTDLKGIVCAFIFTAAFSFLFYSWKIEIANTNKILSQCVKL